jgi:SAM-dependent methyltransferase
VTAAGRGRSRLDDAELERACAEALSGRRGAVFTPAPEARLLAAFSLAELAARRGGPAVAAALRALLTGRRSSALGRALDGARVLDFACGAGALLVAAERLARRHGARLRLHGLDVAPLALRTTAARLAALGSSASLRRADAVSARWPAADLVLGNPPFLRHEALPAAQKARAAGRSGLPRQADLSAHLAALALRHAPVVGLVLPRSLGSSRSAARLWSDAASRGGFRLRLRSSAAGSFAASIDTWLTCWVLGAPERQPFEAAVALDRLSDDELVALVAPLRATRPAGASRVRRSGATPRPPDAVPLSELCQVRFGMKTGCNEFFHLVPLGGGRYRSALLGEVALDEADLAPLLFSLKEARAPEACQPSRLLFRPAGRPSRRALAWVARGEAAGVHRRPSCAGRSPWWSVAPGRGPAPLLYPAKLGARAFAVLNQGGLLEDKKWHALFPRQLEPWVLSLVLSSTPVRLAIDEGARQLTGAQAIADVDCRVLAAAPVPPRAALARVVGALASLRGRLAADEVTTDLAAMLARPAQRELDLLVGGAMGLSPRQVARRRAALLARVAARLDHGAAVRARVASGSIRDRGPPGPLTSPGEGAGRPAGARPR